MNAKQWLAKLIAFDTTSRNSNLQLIECIANYVSGLNLATHLTYDNDKKKANLLVVIPGQDNITKSGIVLSGHTDVVPVDGQQWNSDPFTAVEKEQRIYGRGTSDMKGFIAIVLAVIPQILKMKKRVPIFLAFSFDEEVGCLGAPLLIEDMKAKGFKPTACIVGEPTSCELVVAHKGIQGFRCRLHGRATHSSLTPQGCNAVEYASLLISWIREYGKQLQNERRDELFDVPFTTITSNLITGGTALNIIPSFAEFLFEFRNLPQANPASIMSSIQTYIQSYLTPAMQQEFAEAYIALESLGSIPAFEALEDAPITQLARQVCNDTQIHKVSYATEAGLFQNAGIATILCGPGSIEQAHRPNEFIEIEQLVKYEILLLKIISEYR